MHIVRLSGKNEAPSWISSDLRIYHRSRDRSCYEDLTMDLLCVKAG